ncbi:low temperature requirement protein A [Demequina sp.]|uniref:low temperature requirement protein A n=1 Tax=Demequina sp. TaxID=2050685 RepID=UPI003D0FE53C
MSANLATPSGRWRLIPMRPRDSEEEGRAATPLELFFDLVFVIAVSIAAVNLHHALSEAHFWHGVTSYLVVFFAIWWAWMNFTWFATSFDTDDWLYRTVTVVQMAGVLTLAAGIGDAFENDDFAIMIAGYVLMRVAMVAQWLRASHGAGEARRTTQIYAWGIAGLQVAWVAWLALPDGVVKTAALLALIGAELAIPVVAERRNQTPWHPHHITERYGLFTIIVLGESLLASANAIITARHDETEIGELVPLAVLALVVTASLWWIYFWAPHHERIGGLRQSLRYGYGHYIIFAAAGALSAGIEVEIDVLTGHSELSDVVASLCVTVPVAVFIAAVWWIVIRPHANRLVNTAVPLGALVVLVDPLIPIPIAITTLVVVAIVVVLVLNPPRSVEGEHAPQELAEA